LKSDILHFWKKIRLFVVMGISLSEVNSMHAAVEPDFVDSGLPHDKTLVYHFLL
jgi:hypothetical protein